MGEALQWGKVCNGFSAPLQIFRGEGLQWGEGLQYNTGTQMCRRTEEDWPMVGLPTP